MSDQSGVAHPATPAGVTDPSSIDFAGDPTTDPGHLHTTNSVSGLGYKSLTGPGQTATPGALTQEGPLTVNAMGASDLISFVTAVSSLIMGLTGGLYGVTLTDNSGYGLRITETGAGEIGIVRAPTSPEDNGNIVIHNQSPAGLVEMISDGTGGMIIHSANGNLNFDVLNAGVSGGTLAGVIAGLVGLGLFSS